MPELYAFQKQTVNELLAGKKIVIAKMGSGKSAMMMTWLKSTGRKNILIVTTPSKRDSGDMEVEADTWNGEAWRASLSSFTVVSWHGLGKWLNEHSHDFKEYAYGFDEVAKSKGYSTGMGKAFIKITKNTDCWTGYTGTPGDKWIDFLSYFVATKKVRNKTAFMREFANVQTFKGYPEIVGYRQEDVLKEMWASISSAPDTSIVDDQMPSENHQVVKFPMPTGYKKVLKTRYTLDGEFIETTMGLCHYLRQLCCTNKKLAWVEDFVETLGTGAVFFYSYIEEGDKLEKTIQKKLPKGAKIWRIDGKHHDIPTAETFGEKDIVLTQWASGSEALNLQFINYWVSTSPNYSFSVSSQARGRIKRIGQKKSMYFYYLKCSDTIEGDVYKALSNKSDFAEDVWAIQNNINDKK